MRNATAHSSNRVLGIFGMMILIAMLCHGCPAHAAQTNLCWSANGAPDGCTFEVCRNKTNNIIARTTATNAVVNYRKGDSFLVRTVSAWSDPLTVTK